MESSRPGSACPQDPGRPVRRAWAGGLALVAAFTGIAAVGCSAPASPPATAPAAPDVAVSGAGTRSDIEAGGAQLTFIGPDGRLWLARPDTGQPEVLIQGASTVDQSWSPDGHALAFLERRDWSRPVHLGLYEAASGAVTTRTVRAPSADEMFSLTLAGVEWSPDGRHLLLDSGTGELRHLAVLDPTTGAVEHELGTVSRAIWSPDGQRLALAQIEPLATPIGLGSGDSASLAIWAVGDPSSRVLVRGNASELHRPLGWLPDGRLLFATLNWDEASGSGDETRRAIRVDDETATPEPVAEGDASLVPSEWLARLPQEMRVHGEDPAAWSPGGRWLAYYAGDGPAYGVFVVDTLGDLAPRRLADGTTPRWRPGATTGSP